MHTYKQKNKKPNCSIRQIIIQYMTIMSISLGILLVILMIITSLASTSSVLHENLTIIARTSAQNISSNLHLLTDRMDNLTQKPEWSTSGVSNDAKQTLIDENKKRVEFVWIAAYHTDGTKLYGDSTAPSSIQEKTYFDYLTRTSNMVIGEPEFYENIWQICVGVPVFNADEEFCCYLVGSYKYDMLGDVLSNISIGNGGTAYIVDMEGNMIADKTIEHMTEKQNFYELYGSL